MFSLIPVMAVSGSVGLERNTKICVSNKVPGDAAAVAPQVHPQKSCSWGCAQTALVNLTKPALVGGPSGQVLHSCSCGSSSLGTLTCTCPWLFFGWCVHIEMLPNGSPQPPLLPLAWQAYTADLYVFQRVSQLWEGRSLTLYVAFPHNEKISLEMKQRKKG